MSVPLPALVRLPLPPIGPANVAVKPLVSNVPLPVSVTVRAELKPASHCNVPPPKLSPPLAAPRLLSFDTASVPPLIAVPPE